MMKDVEWWDIPSVALLSMILSVCFFFLMQNFWGMSQARTLMILAAVNCSVWIPSLTIVWAKRNSRKKEFERRRAKRG